jgi:hypothetical protein
MFNLKNKSYIINTLYAVCVFIFICILYYYFNYFLIDAITDQINNINNNNISKEVELNPKPFTISNRGLCLFILYALLFLLLIIIFSDFGMYSQLYVDYNNSKGDK